MMRSMLKTYAAPFAGMSFFWVYVRYQSFFGLLYPLSFEGRLSGLAPYPVLLALLFALCMAVVATRARIEGVFRSRRILVPIVCGLGSVGVALGFGVDEGMLASWVSWVSLLFVAVAFVTGYLAWSIWFCDRFNPGHIVVLAASYMTSLLIFHAWVPMFVAIAVPACTGLFWYLASPPCAASPNTGFSTLRKVTPYVVLFVAFLLAGSVLRGIVDTSEADLTGPTFRWPLSVALSGILLGYCVLFARRQKRATADVSSANDARFYRPIEAMTLRVWAALALLFFGAIFAGLLEGAYVLSGHVVVVARSMFDVLLWVMLCNLVRAEKLSPVLVFTVFSILANVVSWLLSYVVLPSLLTLEVGNGRMQATDVVVLLAVFVLLAFIILVFGAVALRKQDVESPAVTAASSHLTPSVSEDLALSCKLTSREIEVATLFAQGHSLKKVASLLFISTSTAQSHIKSAYRKLGVHSKDELIEKLSG